MNRILQKPRNKIVIKHVGTVFLDASSILIDAHVGEFVLRLVGGPPDVVIDMTTVDTLDAKSATVGKG